MSDEERIQRVLTARQVVEDEAVQRCWTLAHGLRGDAPCPDCLAVVAAAYVDLVGDPWDAS